MKPKGQVRLMKIIINKMKAYLIKNKVFNRSFKKHSDIVIQYQIFSKRKSDLPYRTFAIKEYNDYTSPICSKETKQIVKKYSHKEVVVKKDLGGKKFGNWDRSKYKEYLQSDKWRTFKNKLKRLRGNRCEVCQAPNKILDGHHLTYIRLYNERLDDVQLLCRECHEKVHNRSFKTGKPISNKIKTVIKVLFLKNKKVKIFKSIKTNN